MSAPTPDFSEAIPSIHPIYVNGRTDVAETAELGAQYVLFEDQDQWFRVTRDAPLDQPNHTPQASDGEIAVAVEEKLKEEFRQLVKAVGPSRPLWTRINVRVDSSGVTNGISADDVTTDEIDFDPNA